MFVQVIQGTVADADQVRAAHDRWFEELAPRASGWLGTVAGVSGTGDFIGLVRFASEAAARRQEQVAWWEQSAGTRAAAPSDGRRAR